MLSDVKSCIPMKRRERGWDNGYEMGRQTIDSMAKKEGKSQLN